MVIRYIQLIGVCIVLFNLGNVFFCIGDIELSAVPDNSTEDQNFQTLSTMYASGSAIGGSFKGP